MHISVEAAHQPTMCRGLEERRRTPDHGQEPEADPRHLTRLSRWQGGRQPDGAGEFRQHRRYDHPSGPYGVRTLVADEGVGPDARHQRVVHDLDEDDQARHEGGRDQMEGGQRQVEYGTRTTVQRTSIVKAGTDFLMGSLTRTIWHAMAMDMVFSLD